MKHALEAKTVIRRLIWPAALILFLMVPHCSRHPSADSGRIRPISFSDLARGFEDPDMRYAPFAFWFWDAPLDSPGAPERMRRMAETLIGQGMNPGYAHGRMNMAGEPDLPMEQWLADPWFDAFEGVLAAAESSRAYFGYCDEYWWPTGQAAGRVLRLHPELRAQSLYWRTLEVSGGDTIRIPPCLFAVAARLVSPSLDSLRMKEEAAAVGAERSGLELTPHVRATVVSATMKVIGDGGAFVWHAPKEGAWRVYAFRLYFHPGPDGGRVNWLDPRLAEIFFGLAHEPYFKHFPGEMGKTVPGAFMDHEGGYGYKLAWSGALEERYRGKTGRDIRLWMPLLIDEDAEGRFVRARHDWFDSVSDIYAGYFGSVSGRLAQRGLACTGHLWEENLMWQASAVGDYFKAMRSFSLPGADALGLNVLDVRDLKEAQSVASFESRRFMAEIMGGVGWWGFNPVTLKQAANAAAARGVSHVVAHGVFTTRKLDTNPWLPDWFDEHPLFSCLHLWTDFVRRASWINSHGRPAADVLLVNPMESVWALCGPGVFDPAFKDRVPGPAIFSDLQSGDPEPGQVEMKRLSAWWTPPLMQTWYDGRVGALNDAYTKVMRDLTRDRIEFLIADGFYLRRMKVRDGLLVRPPFEFRTVILPPLMVLSLDAAGKLAAFTESGGTVIALGDLPAGSTDNGWLDPDMVRIMDRLRKCPSFHPCRKDFGFFLKTSPDGPVPPVRFESGGFEMLQQHRKIDGRDFFWLANNTGRPQRTDLLLSGLKGSASIWDCETGAIRGIPSVSASAGLRVSLSFDDLEAYWLVVDPSASSADPVKGGGQSAVRTTALDGPWFARVDMGIQTKQEHPAGPPPWLLKGRTLPLETWEKWGMKTFSGFVDYEKDVQLTPDDGRLNLDLGTVYHTARVWVNGAEAGMRLWPPYRFDITNCVRPGKNRIRVRVGNLLNNSYGDFQPSGLVGPVTLLTR
jgi:hypothetical protein